MHQQQMELHQAQMQYASYGMMPVGPSIHSVFETRISLSSPRIVPISDVFYSLRVMFRLPHQRRRHRHPRVNNHHHRHPMEVQLAQVPCPRHRHLLTWTLTRRIGMLFIFVSPFPGPGSPLLTCHLAGLLMAMMLIRRSSRNGRQARWRNTTNIIHPRVTLPLALTPPLQALVGRRHLRRLLVSLHRRHRLPAKHRGRLHAQSVDPSHLYMCFAIVGRVNI